jgi:N-methylhydantoinase B
MTESTIDPISLEILWGRLVSIVDESAGALQRTSFSTTVRESNDFACVLLGPDGTTLAENTVGVPSFAGVMSLVMRRVLERFPPNTWKPGDIGLTNDPWINTGHLPDTTIICPIFHKGKLVAFTGNTAHKADIGGGGYAADATEIYEEGLRIPICKLYNEGHINELLVELIRNNVRVSESVLGDLHAQVAAGHVCAQRVRDFLDEQGITELNTIGRAIQVRAEAAMRQAIAALPDGDYTSVVRSDGYDVPTDIHTRIIVRGNDLTVDFAGTSPQIRRGINSVYNYTYAFTCYTLKCLLDPQTRKNEGSYKPFRIVVPEGSILNARFPAPVTARAMTGHFVSSAVLLALADALPERVIADSGSCPGLRVALRGVNAHGGRFAQVLFPNGGMGARAHSDGLSTTGFPTNAGGGSVEIMESVSPLVFWTRELHQDSGGPGRFRGGLGQHIVVESVAESALDASTMFDRVDYPPVGVHGGLPGGRSRLRLNKTQPVPSKGKFLMHKGDQLTIDYAGGGGYGKPAQRDRELVRADLRAGLISEEAARTIYKLKMDTKAKPAAGKKAGAPKPAKKAAAVKNTRPAKSSKPQKVKARSAPKKAAPPRKASTSRKVAKKTASARRSGKTVARRNGGRK